MSKKITEKEKTELEEFMKQIQKETVLSSNLYNLYVRGTGQVFNKSILKKEFVDLFDKLVEHKYIQELFVETGGKKISVGFNPIKRIEDESWINVTDLNELLFHKKMRYKAYLQTYHWIDFSNMARESANHKCQECGAENAILSVHHLNYICKGEERLEDILVLCRSCHAKKHSHSIKSKQNVS